ncbi:MAG: SDR family oxidoreductase [Phycisphaerales bacterium]|nr:SDR family oxidoreductase [Phycisphaerales bacterium]
MAQRVVVITGGSRGIGLAAAEQFAAAGDRVVISGRTESDLRTAAAAVRAAGGTCEPVVADVARREDAHRLITQAQEIFGRIDVLVNNAGKAPLAPVAQLDPAEFESTLALNLGGVFHTAQAAWPGMQAQGGGVIVNVSSVASVDPFPGFAVYGATKAWVNLFSQALAAEGKPHGIRVYSVAPGAVETGLLRATFPDLPAEHCLRPEAVAAAIVAVCDETWLPATGNTIFLRR